MLFLSSETINIQEVYVIKTEEVLEMETKPERNTWARKCWNFYSSNKTKGYKGTKQYNCKYLHLIFLVKLKLIERHIIQNDEKLKKKDLLEEQNVFVKNV